MIWGDLRLSRVGRDDRVQSVGLPGHRACGEGVAVCLDGPFVDNGSTNWWAMLLFDQEDLRGLDESVCCYAVVEYASGCG